MNHLASLLNFLFHAGDLFLPRTVRDFLYTYIIGSNRTMFYISYWSVLHFISGIIVGLILDKPYNTYTVAFIIHWMWEMLQVVSGMTPATGRGFVDFVTDTCMFMGGYAIITYKG
jgi:hypothetical protein